MSGLLSDDMYEHLVYDDFEFFSPAQVEPGLYERTLTLNGVSKAYCMTGWRIGYAVGRKHLIKAMGPCSRNRPPTPTRRAVGLGRCARRTAGFHSEAQRVFKSARDLCVSMLNQAKGLRCPKPEGAFYVYPSCGRGDGAHVAIGKKLESTRTLSPSCWRRGGAVVQRTAFGVGPAFRVSYAVATSQVEEACRRIQRFCGNLT